MLRASREVAGPHAWRLVEPRRLLSWARRGVPFDGLTDAERHCLVRCHPEDGVNGFFVAVFQNQKVDNNTPPVRPNAAMAATINAEESVKIDSRHDSKNLSVATGVNQDDVEVGLNNSPSKYPQQAHKKPRKRNILASSNWHPLSKRFKF